MLNKNEQKQILVLAWNINGLRAVLKRRKCTLKELLELLEADVICFQETKLTKADFDRTLALVDGWESFFSINRGRTAYSGTATFCKKAVAPMNAQEGVSGILHREGGAQKTDLCCTSASFAQALLKNNWSRHSPEELKVVDAEGRCVVTDHGAFVLFNIYGPAITNEESAKERFAYKLKFYQALQCRVDALRSLGRRVIIAGDLNIAPQPIDSCEPGPLADFADRADRKWLNGLLKCGGGPFVDLFREKHPRRTEAYTCWSTASSARVNNWGTRIDLILAADGIPNSQDGMPVGKLLHSADILAELPGSDHAPVWACLQLPYALQPPDVPPPLSTRYLFTGKQSSINSFLVPGAPGPSEEGTAAGAQEADIPLLASQSSAPADKLSTGWQSLKPKASGVSKGKAKAKDRKVGPVQRSLMSFMQPSAAEAEGSGQRQQIESQAGGGLDFREATAVAGEMDTEGFRGQPILSVGASYPTEARAVACGDAPAAAAVAASEAGALWEGDNGERHSAAKAAWQQIQDRMKPPKCKGHGEDMVIRKVKKKGPNNGRLFYVCHRPDGAAPKGRCDDFVWVGNRGLLNTVQNEERKML